MRSLSECRIEDFICRLCSQIERNVIHIYTDEGLQKKLEQKINVYLKINLSRYDPLPKVICLPCDAKLEQHHRFIQRVIQNQKKIQGERPGIERPIIPLLEEHLRVRVSPVLRPDGSGTNTYNIEAILSDSDSSNHEHSNRQSLPNLAPQESESSLNTNDNTNEHEDVEMLDDFTDMDTSSDDNDLTSSSSSTSPSQASVNNDEPLVFSPDLAPVSASWSSSSSSSSSDSSRDSNPPDCAPANNQDEI